MAKKLKEDDEAIMICSTIDVPHYTEGRLRHCQRKECRALIWLSNSSVASLKQMFPKRDFTKRPPVAICMHCMFKINNGDIANAEFLPLTDIQRTEILTILNETKDKPN